MKIIIKNHKKIDFIANYMIIKIEKNFKQKWSNHRNSRLSKKNTTKNSKIILLLKKIINSKKTSKLILEKQQNIQNYYLYLQYLPIKT